MDRHKNPQRLLDAMHTIRGIEQGNLGAALADRAAILAMDDTTATAAILAGKYMAEDDLIKLQMYWQGQWEEEVDAMPLNALKRIGWGDGGAGAAKRR
jgi:hypothetical protein